MTAPQQSSDPLVGLPVTLDRAVDQRSPCHDNTATLAAGTGPHAYALHCARCGAHRGWLPKVAADFLSKTVRLFGVPNEPFIIRDAMKR
jgi:hypothetical protein